MVEGKKLKERLNDKEKAEKIEKLLLMPIKCRKKYKTIEIEGEVIYTGQEFYASPDEDMSDIAIAFYEIMYSKVLNSTKILTKSGITEITDITNCCFAGDTMNSYNTVANLVKRKNKKLTLEDKELLGKYQKKYHCLANFWILPSCLGRRGKKGNNLDSMDIFLNCIDKDYEGVMKKHESYYEAWNNISDFRKDHFLNGYINKDTDIVRKSYADKDGETLINEAIARMEQRAKDISKSDIGIELWKYFYEHNLVC